MSYLLCIDLGGSVCKSVIYDLELHEASRAYQDVVTIYPKPRWAEQNPEEWWKATVNVVKEAVNKGGINPKDIAGVAVCGQSHGPVLVDGNGNALFPCIVWPDLRAIKQSEILGSRIGRKISAYYTAPKLLWIKDNYPSIFSEMYTFVLPKDYIRMKLAGNILTDRGDAMATMMYDRERNTWDYPLIDLVGIPHDKLPAIVPPERIVGGITREASEKIGLKEGTPVIAGTGDAQCILLGIKNVIKPGKAVIYLGSAPAIFVSANNGKSRFMGPGGQSLKWFKELLNSGRSELSYKILDMEAQEVEPGSGRLLFFPHLMGERAPFYNPYARGVIFGLSLGHKRGHLFRAMMEGIAFQLKLILNNLNDLKGSKEINEIIVIGGGAKSFVFRQIIADVFNIPVCLPDKEEWGTLGLAILLLASLGVCENIFGSSKKLDLKIIEKVNPRRRYSRRYEKMFNLYAKLEDTLSEFFTN